MTVAQAKEILATAAVSPGTLTVAPAVLVEAIKVVANNLGR